MKDKRVREEEWRNRREKDRERDTERWTHREKDGHTYTPTNRYHKSTQMEKQIEIDG